jgi:hypothetical protein
MNSSEKRKANKKYTVLIRNQNFDKNNVANRAHVNDAQGPRRSHAFCMQRFIYHFTTRGQTEQRTYSYLYLKFSLRSPFTGVALIALTALIVHWFRSDYEKLNSFSDPFPMKMTADSAASLVFQYSLNKFVVF